VLSNTIKDMVITTAQSLCSLIYTSSYYVSQSMMILLVLWNSL